MRRSVRVSDTTNPDPDRIFIAGAGYVGARLARCRMDRGDSVTCFVRSEAGAIRHSESGIAVVQWDFDTGERGSLAPGWADGSVIYYLAPPPATGKDDPRVGGFLDAVTGTPRRIVYMSTTGVYGDCGGELVTETRPTDPGTGRARRRVAAEDRVRRWCEGRSSVWVILRVPGIYGPGRLPTARLGDSVPVIRAEDAGPGNRIHIDDLVSVCLAAGVRTAAGEVEPMR